MTWALLVVALAQNSATPPKLPGEVSIQQQLNAQIPLDLMFRDESGKIVRLREYFRGKPVLINFMYYRCPMLCSMVMEGISSTLTELKFDVGKEFEVITVSIDPRDMPREAVAKKDKYIKRYGRLGAASGWHFLTGHESSIRALTNAAGGTHLALPVWIRIQAARRPARARRSVGEQDRHGQRSAFAPVLPLRSGDR
ncbi:MAG: hypothetical protein DMF59_01600 [Acidobacteria bacterium]|nr:MAG: hypothetical protein DMF59_01600 [Acidobacteriota bacterium]